MAANPPTGQENDQFYQYAVYRAYRDVLIRIGDQGENFNRSEALDVLARIVDSRETSGRTEKYDMLCTVIRAAAEMELDDDARREIEITDAWLSEA